MLYRAYIDDSADRDRKLFVISGAIMGDESRWAPLYKPWRDRLAQDGLQYFKSSQCDTLNGQFHKFRAVSDGRAKADKVRDDLDDIIRGLQLVSLGVILPIPVHQQMLDDPVKFGALPQVPYRLAFQQVLAECSKAMRLLGRNNIVTFAHDDGSDFPPGAPGSRPFFGR